MYALKLDNNTYSGAFDLILLGVLDKPPKAARLVLSKELPEEVRHTLSAALKTALESEHDGHKVSSPGFSPRHFEVVHFTHQAGQSRGQIREKFFESIREQGLNPVSENVITVPFSAFQSDAPRSR
jgi:hypothetical protein